MTKEEIDEEIAALSHRLKYLYAARRELRQTAKGRRPTAKERQTEVWRRIGLGQTLEKIAAETGQTITTVRGHLYSHLWHMIDDDSGDYYANKTKMVELNRTLPPSCQLSLRMFCPYRAGTQEAESWMEQHRQKTSGVVA
jgi:hypothetical protein